MNDKDRLRRLNNLLYKYFSLIRFYDNWKQIDLENYNKDPLNERLKEKCEIYQLADELKISDSELKYKWSKIQGDKAKQLFLYNQMPKRERKDNKHMCVGSGGRNRTMVRYPSKKRSRATWKRFYLLFPSLAEEDNWDGKTSNKMK